MQCAKCHTLISRQKPSHHINHITDDSMAFYSKNYWFSHQENMGLPNLLSRARSDLPERCIYWMSTLLNYKLPPSRVLEVGCGHGGFVALLQWAGFDATGLELSPWVVDFAGKNFSIPVLFGSLEDQHFERDSFDVIVLMDVMEHLIDPATTIARCLTLLKPEGILLIQTPCFSENASYDQMVKEKSRFLSHLKKDEHLYLFSRQGIELFFQKLEAPYIAFEQPIFSHYDMFFIVSKKPVIAHSPEEREQALTATPGGRLILAMLDMHDDYNSLKAKYEKAETDRAARWEQIDELSKLLKDSEADRHARLGQIDELSKLLKDSETDRDARMEQINGLSRLLNDSETDRDARLMQIDELSRLLGISEADREARLHQINELSTIIKDSEADRDARLRQIEDLSMAIKDSEADRDAGLQQINILRSKIERIESSMLYTLLKKIRLIK